ncbi:MAG: YciI family protein [Paracoccaceae bacterium]
MPKFIIAYLGSPKPSSPPSPEDQQKHMQAWKDWMGGLGDAVVSMPAPLMGSKVVTANGAADNTDPNAMTGFMVVEAADMNEAVEMAMGDPYLAMEGAAIQVGEMRQMG